MALDFHPHGPNNHDQYQESAGKSTMRRPSEVALTSTSFVNGHSRLDGGNCIAQR